MTYSNWCPSCTCGWGYSFDREPLPFQVKPPEAGCKNPECDCHESFWWNADKERMQELEKRYLYGNR